MLKSNGDHIRETMIDLETQLAHVRASLNFLISKLKEEQARTETRIPETLSLLGRMKESVDKLQSQLAGLL